MAKARIKLPRKLLDALRSKWENLIEEYIKDENDRYIATRYFLDGICLIEIAEELDNPKSMSYMKRHKAMILKTLIKHINEL